MKAFVSIRSAIVTSCPLMRDRSQTSWDTLHPLFPLLHPRSAPFNHSAISTERLRRDIHCHHEFQSPQRGSMVWYSSGPQTTFVRSFTLINTPLPPSDERFPQGKVKRTFV